MGPKPWHRLLHRLYNCLGTLINQFNIESAKFYANFSLVIFLQTKRWNPLADSTRKGFTALFR